MPARQCGECTACCEGWLKSSVTGMSPGKPCKFSTPAGCAIYSSRPYEPCRNFTCGWLQDDSPLPDDMRPDKAGVIVSLDWQWGAWTAIRAVAAGSSIPDDSAQWLKSHARQTGMPLVLQEFVTSGEQIVGERVRAYGPAEFSKAINDNSIDAEMTSL